MKGYNKENCYQLIGYPSDFKGRRKQGAPSVYHRQRAHTTHCGGGLPEKARGGCSTGQTGIITTYGKFHAGTTTENGNHAQMQSQRTSQEA